MGKMGEGIKVLVVEDDESVSEVMRIHLETMFGFEVFQAENGVRALDMIDEAHPHCILLDMRMPVMDGEEFLATYKGALPIFVCSGFGDTISVPRALAILTKPIDAKELAGLIIEAVTGVPRNLANGSG